MTLLADSQTRLGLGALDGGRIVHELEPLFEAGDLEHALHRLGALHDHEAAAVLLGPLVGADHAAQSGGVEEGEPREVENHVPARALPALELVIDLPDRGQVEFTAQRDVYESITLLALDFEDRHRREPTESALCGEG